MDRLRCLQVFAEVVRSQSFVRAAWKLSVSKATVTKHVAWLETSMGSQLLHRSSKQVTLTEAGLRVLETAQDLLERYERLEADVRDSVNLPRGSIRVGAPPAFGIHHLTPVVSRFSERYPDIEITVLLDDGRLDLLSEGLDLSIRIAPQLEDASYIAYPLMKAPQVLVASAAYLERAGVPRTARDLQRHNCLVHTLKSGVGHWRFEGDPPEEVRVRGTVRSNIGEVLKKSALLGAGIALHPYYMVSDELRSGALQVVLPGLVPEGLDIYAVFSTRRNMPVRVRALLEFLKDWAAHPPAWAQPQGLDAGAAGKAPPAKAARVRRAPRLTRT
ncbi:LysR family transcriptional regulator [Ramlibacter rhizophilus]|uniref:LysR family transcriptional regulator n=1 Tax=Ramlibacter rhizophilus TaxID=1781167 RepID=A0A4Z0C0D6_9BURK|nr:LysR family transcriptional regulator [Ramlibacter rhizophilus]TFZ04392.1 LysR family transcriptional regulator [Ramlibacter rhizophilus]